MSRTRLPTRWIVEGLLASVLLGVIATAGVAVVIAAQSIWSPHPLDARIGVLLILCSTAIGRFGVIVLASSAEWRGAHLLGFNVAFAVGAFLAFILPTSLAAPSTVFAPSGFAADAASYAVSWSFLLGFAPGFVVLAVCVERRSRRAARSLCRGCGYPMGDVAARCAECGRHPDKPVRHRPWFVPGVMPAAVIAGGLLVLSVGSFVTYAHRCHVVSERLGRLWVELDPFGRAELRSGSDVLLGVFVPFDPALNLREGVMLWMPGGSDRPTSLSVVTVVRDQNDFLAVQPGLLHPPVVCELSASDWAVVRQDGVPRSLLDAMLDASRGSGLVARYPTLDGILARPRETIVVEFGVGGSGRARGRS